MLGGYGVFGKDAYVEKTFDLSGAPQHSAVRVQLDFVKIDSWNGETAYLRLDGELAWSRSFWYYAGSQHCGLSDYNRSPLHGLASGNASLGGQMRPNQRGECNRAKLGCGPGGSRRRLLH